jgi:hypothetical protein
MIPVSLLPLPAKGFTSAFARKLSQEQSSIQVFQSQPANAGKIGRTGKAGFIVDVNSTLTLIWPR